ASERIFKLLDEPVLVESDPNAIPLDHPRGEIEFRNVWFSYRRDSGFVHTNPEMKSAPEPADEDWVLRDVSFRVDPGQTIAIVGHTGAGKTTLISLLLRFYDVQRGHILLDGKDIRTIELQDLRRQLINFARALAHNPRFLILDEATSSVDTKTELLIREALNRLLSGRTALVIAHRLSTIQHADRILVFHKGRLREQGAHQELLALRGIYYRLYQLQYKEQELHLPFEAGRSAEPSVLPAND